MDRKRIIVVLGMHRSGTSVMARGLQVFDIDLGSNLMLPNEAVNAKGFWEDNDIYALNREMLYFLESDWHFLSPIGDAAIKKLHDQGFLTRAVDLIKTKTASTRIFGFKDPRVAILLAFWKDVFAQLNFQISYVVAIRNPRSVCASLATRNKFSIEKSQLLWLAYVITSLNGVVGENYLVVDYDRMLASPDHEIKRISEKLNLTINPSAKTEFVSEFLSENLRHSSFDPSALKTDTAFLEIVVEIYTFMLAMAKDIVSPINLQEKIPAWNAYFRQLQPILSLFDKLYLQISRSQQELQQEKNLSLDQESEMKQKLAQASALITSMQNSRTWKVAKILQRILSFVWPKRP